MASVPTLIEVSMSDNSLEGISNQNDCGSIKLFHVIMNSPNVIWGVFIDSFQTEISSRETMTFDGYSHARIIRNAFAIVACLEILKWMNLQSILTNF